MFAEIIGTMFAVCILVLVIGGFEMILSFGNVERLKRGERRIRYAIVGFGLILLSWLIIDTLMHVIGAKNADNWWELDLSDYCKKFMV